MGTRTTFKRSEPTTWAADLATERPASDAASGLIPTAGSAGGGWARVEMAEGAITSMPARNGQPASDGARLPDDTSLVRLPVPNVSRAEHWQRDSSPRQPWGRFCSPFCRRLVWLDRNPYKAAELAERDRQRLRENVIGCCGEWCVSDYS